MTLDLLAVVHSLPRIPLVDAADIAPRAPGAYLQFWATDRPEIAALMPAFVRRGEFPSYVGCSTTSVGNRLQRYRQSLAELPGVDVTELYVSVLPCDTAASAAFAEASLLESPIRGVLNGIGGWGNKNPGARRLQQTSSPVDALLAPGRSWTRPPRHVDQIRARCQLIATLAAIDPTGPRWPPLITP